VAASPAVGSRPDEQADRIRITMVKAKGEILILIMFLLKKILSASVFAVSIPASFSGCHP